MDVLNTKECHYYCEYLKLERVHIVDCRSNFDKFFNGIRIVGINVPRTYEYYYEEIIRG